MILGNSIEKEDMDRISNIIFGVFAVVSAYFTAKTFATYGVDIADSVGFVLLAIVMQSFQVFSAINSKSAFSKGKIIKGIAWFALLYLPMTLFSLYGSVSSGIQSISSKMSQYSVQSVELTEATKALKALDTKEQNTLTRQSKIAGDEKKGASVKGYNEDLDSMKKERNKNVAIIKSYEGKVVVNPFVSYGLIAGIFKTTGDVIFSFLLTLICVLMEAGVFICAPILNTGKQAVSFSKILKFVEEAFYYDAKQKKNKIKAIPVIAKLTKFSKKECKEFKNFLTNSYIGSVKILEVKAGYNQVNFDKKQIVERIMTATKKA
jgi:hypothetical protein